MDRNLLLAFALSFLVLSLWSMWTADQRPVPEGNVPIEQPAPAGPGEPAPAAGDAAGGAYPELPDAQPVPASAPQLPAQPVPAETEAAAQRIEVDTPLYRAHLTTRGAALEGWELENYTDHGGARIQMVPAAGLAGVLAATPFRELGIGDLGQTGWQVEKSDATRVVFRYERGGVALRKTWTFEPETYAFHLAIEVANQSAAAISPRFLVDWPAMVRREQDFVDQALAVLHDGSVVLQPLAGIGSPGFFGSLIGRQPVREYPVMTGEIDWTGFQSTYFLGAIAPESPTQARARFVVLETSTSGAAQLFFDPVQLAPGQTITREFEGFIGPKEADRLATFGRGAEASIDRGWSWVSPLTRLFTWLLHALYSVIPNYGVAIILLTILVRAVTAPLTVRQMRSMERLRRVQPRMKEIQEKYKDDRQKQSEELMKLYRLEKVNPLGGCFPMLLQLPVFVGLFYALRSSLELRHAPFVGWINDLSAPDELFTIPGLGLPVRVLPIVMGATMFFQQKITPMQTPDPMQARMMMIVMPIMMTVLFYQFPSGLVLYWMLSNVLAILHQLWIGRNMGPPARAVPASAA